MERIYRPTKEQIRDWLRARQISNEPPPDIEQIQRMLGWKQPEIKRQVMQATCVRREIAQRNPPDGRSRW